MDKLSDPKDQIGVFHTNSQKLLMLMSNKNMTLMVIKPHAIFCFALKRTSRQHVLTGFSPLL